MPVQPPAQHLPLLGHHGRVHSLIVHGPAQQPVRGRAKRTTTRQPSEHAPAATDGDQRAGAADTLARTVMSAKVEGKIVSARVDRGGGT